MHRTPHHTDGDGIGPKLTGCDLTKRLDELCHDATMHHRMASNCLRGMLEHAKAAGDALLEAKRRLGHRLKWSKWRHRNLIATGVMSKETSVVYMRIARHWDDPRIKDAYASGMKMSSIAQFLDVVRNCPPKHEKKPPTDLELLRAEVRKVLAEKVRNLTRYELEMLLDSHGLQYAWDRLYQEVKHLVQIAVGDVYEDDESEERAVWRRMVCRKPSG